jgi:hypothetical protein
MKNLKDISINEITQFFNQSSQHPNKSIKVPKQPLLVPPNYEDQIIFWNNINTPDEYDLLEVGKTYTVNDVHPTYHSFSLESALTPDHRRIYFADCKRFCKPTEWKHAEWQLLPFWLDDEIKPYYAVRIEYYSSDQHPLMHFSTEELINNSVFVASIEHPYLRAMFQYIPPAKSDFYLSHDEWGYHLFQHVKADVEMFDGELLEAIDIVTSLPHQESLGNDKIKISKLALMLWYLHDQSIPEKIVDPIEPHEYFEPLESVGGLLLKEDLENLFDKNKAKSIQIVIELIFAI